MDGISPPFFVNVTDESWVQYPCKMVGCTWSDLLQISIVEVEEVSCEFWVSSMILSTCLHEEHRKQMYYDTVLIEDLPDKYP